jgi:carbon-monoxide dehydrogenase small subunit
MTHTMEIKLNINGQTYAIAVEPRKTLVDAIREDCGLTGTHIGCAALVPWWSITRRSDHV